MAEVTRHSDNGTVHINGAQNSLYIVKEYGFTLAQVGLSPSVYYVSVHTETESLGLGFTPVLLVHLYQSLTVQSWPPREPVIITDQATHK